MEDIFEAAEEGDEEEVIRLLDADPLLLEGEYNNGDRPLAVAALCGQLGVVTLLIARGANIDATGFRGRTALHQAGRGGNEEVVDLLLDKGAHANGRDDDGFTPLMLACDNDHLGVVKMLVQHMGGQGLDEGNVRGWTALHYAANWRQEEMVRFLLLAGADATITTNRRETPRALAEKDHRHSAVPRPGRARCIALFKVRPLTC
jgi:ankyrin repeat protein